MKLIVATGDYAHTRTLAGAGDGDGLEIDWRPGRPERIFARALSEDAPFDVAEMSLATTWARVAASDTRFVALPVFPSRMYRLSAFYVREGLDRPEQLEGGRLGVVRYGQTAVVWGRAFLAREYGIDLSGLSWWVAERQSFEPEGVRLNDAGRVTSLQAMLAAGQLDCLFATSVPEVYRKGEVRRLFPDWPQKEQALFKRSSPVPIMHTVLVRRRLVETAPDLAGALVRRFEAARLAALDWLRDTDASVLPVPGHHGFVETQTRGGAFDAFENGLRANREVLESFAAHMHRQGLTPRKIPPEDVFHPLD